MSQLETISCKRTIEGEHALTAIYNCRDSNKSIIVYLLSQPCVQVPNPQPPFVQIRGLSIKLEIG